MPTPSSPSCRRGRQGARLERAPATMLQIRQGVTLHLQRMEQTAENFEFALGAKKAALGPERHGFVAIQENETHFRLERPPSIARVAPVIDEALVHTLISGQFPQWAHLQIRAVLRSGWDNRSFRLGDEFVVRLPGAEEYAPQVDKEQEWLPFLARSLSYPIPVPVGRGAPGAGYPWGWSIYRWLECAPARRPTTPPSRATASSSRGNVSRWPSTPEPVEFRLMGRDDLRLLHEWIHRPHVAQWWAAAVRPRISRHPRQAFPGPRRIRR